MLKNLISHRRYTHNAEKRGIILNKQVRSVSKPNLLQEKIREFFCNDQITVQSPNKKDLKTFQKQKELKRYSTDTFPNF